MYPVPQKLDKTTGSWLTLKAPDAHVPNVEGPRLNPILTPPSDPPFPHATSPVPVASSVELAAYIADQGDRQSTLSAHAGKELHDPLTVPAFATRPPSKSPASRAEPMQARMINGGTSTYSLPPVATVDDQGYVYVASSDNRVTRVQRYGDVRIVSNSVPHFSALLIGRCHPCSPDLCATRAALPSRRVSLSNALGCHLHRKVPRRAQRSQNAAVATLGILNARPP